MRINYILQHIKKIKSVMLLLCVLLLISPDAEGDEPALIIKVDETEIFQEIVGFGASLTDSSAWLLYHIFTPEKRAEVMEELFNPSKGIGLSYLRQLPRTF